jgi:hypothetical protein
LVLVDRSNLHRLLSYNLLSLITGKPIGQEAPDVIEEAGESSDGEEEIAAAAKGKKKGAVNAEGAWCWRDGCEGKPTSASSQQENDRQLMLYLTFSTALVRLRSSDEGSPEHGRLAAAYCESRRETRKLYLAWYPSISPDPTLTFSCHLSPYPLPHFPYTDDRQAANTLLESQETLKDLAHPSSLYAPVVETHASTLVRYEEAVGATDGDGTDGRVTRSLSIIGVPPDEIAARCETVLNATMA